MFNLTQEKAQDSFMAFMQKTYASSWVEIDKKALEHNLSAYKSLIKSSLLAPVIKSNAYGHGIELIAKICDEHKAVDLLCVVSLHEALFLRSIGIKKPLLVLGILDGDLQAAIVQDIALIVYDMSTIMQLNALGAVLNKKAIIHLKVDTGLSRLGLYLDSCNDEIVKIAQQIYELPFIAFNGIFTHFSDSDRTDQTYTQKQLACFELLLEQLESMGIVIPLKHAANTPSSIAASGAHLSMVRVGLGTYGLWPSAANKKIAQENHPGFFLKPVLSWKTKIIQIKELPAGSFVGYNRTYCVERAMRVAVLPVGYWDGLDRGLSNKGHVVINNQLAPILGRVSMNLCTVDITGLTVSIDDTVTLLGDHPGITADDIAQLCQTINYEIITRINPLLPRKVQE
jgi:alanine racemase